MNIQDVIKMINKTDIRANIKVEGITPYINIGECACSSINTVACNCECACSACNYRYERN